PGVQRRSRHVLMPKKALAFAFAVAVASLALSMLACTHDFDTFEPASLAAGDAAPDVSSPVPPVGSNPGDSGAGVDPCAGFSACVSQDTKCTGTCVATDVSCTTGCPSGSSGSTCRKSCDQTRRTCTDGCTSACKTCAGSCTRSCP